MMHSGSGTLHVRNIVTLRLYSRPLGRSAAETAAKLVHVARTRSAGSPVPGLLEKGAEQASARRRSSASSGPPAAGGRGARRA